MAYAKSTEKRVSLSRVVLVSKPTQIAPTLYELAVTKPLASQISAVVSMAAEHVVVLGSRKHFYLQYRVELAARVFDLQK